MSIADFWEEKRKESQERRAQNRESSAAILREQQIEFKELKA